MSTIDRGIGLIFGELQYIQDNVWSWEGHRREWKNLRETLELNIFGE